MALNPVVKRLGVFGLGAVPVLALLVLLLPSPTYRVTVPGTPILLYDVAEPFIAIPYAAFGLLWVFGGIRRGWPPEARLQALLLASLFLVFMGYGLHNAANSIRGQAAYENLRFPQEMFALVDLWDEVIGHTLLGAGFVGLFGYGILLQDLNRSGAPLSRADLAVMTAFAVPTGLVAARGAIEGTLALPAVFGGFAMFVGGLAVMRLRGVKPGEVPFNTTVLILLLSFLAFMAFFYVQGGWAQVSAWRG